MERGKRYIRDDFPLCLLLSGWRGNVPGATGMQEFHVIEQHVGVLMLGVMEVPTVLGLLRGGDGKCSREELNKLWSPEHCTDGLQHLG